MKTVDDYIAGAPEDVQGKLKEIRKAIKAELKEYVTAKATVQFPLDKKLPTSLIKKLVKARMKINEAREE